MIPPLMDRPAFQTDGCCYYVAPAYKNYHQHFSAIFLPGITSSYLTLPSSLPPSIIKLRPNSITLFAPLSSSCPLTPSYCPHPILLPSPHPLTLIPPLSIPHSTILYLSLHHHLALLPISFSLQTRWTSKSSFTSTQVPLCVHLERHECLIFMTLYI